MGTRRAGGRRGRLFTALLWTPVQLRLSVCSEGRGDLEGLLVGHDVSAERKVI